MKECRSCQLLERRDRGEAPSWDSIVRTSTSSRGRAISPMSCDGPRIFEATGDKEGTWVPEWRMNQVGAEMRRHRDLP